MKKKGYRRKITFEKKIGSHQGSLESWVNPPDQPSFARLLH